MTTVHVQVFHGGQWVPTTDHHMWSEAMGAWIPAKLYHGGEWIDLPSSGTIDGPPPDPDPPFIIGETKPGPGNTGVPAGMSLTPVSGDVTFSTPNETVEGKEFRGYVNVTASGVTFRNCRFVGRNVGFISKYGLLNVEAATNTTVERCTFAQAYPRFWNPAIKGKSMTVHRCDISAVVDGIEIRGGGNTITGNYFHDFYFHDGSSEQAGDAFNPPGWTHNDGIQFHVSAASAPTHTVRGNFFDWYPGEGGVFDRNGVLETGYQAADGLGSAWRRPLRSPKTNRLQWGACLTLDCPSNGPAVTGAAITENWLSGGGVAFQAAGTHGPHAWGTITRNLVDQDWYTGMSQNHWYAIRYDANHVPTDATGNTWDDLPTVPASDRGNLLTVGVNKGLEQA